MRALTVSITVVVLLLCSINSRAEKCNISGVVRDKRGNSIETFCAQLLTTKDSTYVAGGWYLDGSYSIDFDIESGDSLTLSISSLGYIDVYVPIYISNSDSIEIPLIVLEESVNSLPEVTVKGRKNNFMQKSDRVVMSVDNTPLQESGTALDILDKSVLLQVDSDNSVKLLSRGVAQIYLNGHKLGSNDQLATIPSEDILSVEIIENPSSEYDGEATSVVNILTKRRRAILESGGKIINTTTKRRGYSNKTSLQYYISGERHNFNSSYSFGESNREYDNLYQREYSEEEPIKVIYNNDDEKRHLSQDHNLRIEDRYQISDRSSLSLSLSGSYIKGESNSENNNIVEPLGDTLFSSTVTPLTGEYLNGMLSYRLDSTTTGSWEIFGEFYRYRGEKRSKIYEEGIEKQDNLDDRYTINALELKNRSQLRDNLILNSGASYTATNNSSDQDFISEAETSSSSYVSDEIKSAIWANLSLTSDRWSFSGGVRGEILNRVSEMNDINIVDKSNINTLPNFSVSRDMGEKFQVGVTYGKRLRHPSFSDLNPAVDYIDPLVYRQGNPELLSEKIHRTNLKLSYMKYLSLSTFYQSVDNAMVWFVEQDSENSDVTRGVQRNIDNKTTYGFNSVLPYQSDWFTFYVAGGYSWNITTIDRAADRLKQSSWYMKSGLDLKLPLNFKSNITALYYSDGIEGMWSYRGAYKVDANLERSFLDKRLNMRLIFNDIFNSNKMLSEADFGYGKISYSSYNDDSMVGLRLSYRFNRERKGSSESSILNSELNRINSL